MYIFSCRVYLSYFVSSTILSIFVSNTKSSKMYILLEKISKINVVPYKKYTCGKHRHLIMYLYGKLYLIIWQFEFCFVDRVLEIACHVCLYFSQFEYIFVQPLFLLRICHPSVLITFTYSLYSMSFEKLAKRH